MNLIERSDVGITPVFLRWLTRRVNKKSHMWDADSLNLRTVPQEMRKQLGEFLRRRRGDLSYVEFCRKAGLSRSTLQRLEMGEQNITLDSLESLLKRLKSTPNEVFGR
jgi:DNA-binding Xre family transcriptional regulator